MTLTFTDTTEDIIDLHVVTAQDLDSWLNSADARTRTWVETFGFTAAKGQAVLIPAQDGTASLALAGLGNDRDRRRGRFLLSAAAKSLPLGTYRIASDMAQAQLETECLGWLLAGYHFDRYKPGASNVPGLVAPSTIDAGRIEAIAAGEALTRDLINTPASDMGPAELETAARDLANTHGATCDVIVGDDLIMQNFPMIHAVGRASPRAPRLIDMRWGSTGPKLTLVGKGVCFDTGGLDLKPAASMGLMKKDMGGSATVLGLAHMIMSLGLPLQLRVLIPAVENAVSGNAFRPQDVLQSRKGLTVEVNNTDAEGRLVLADALALADEEETDLIISMATLTGAARVAVGPDLAPFYTDDDTHATALTSAASQVADPVWRMPFHEPYEAMIEPGIADLNNAPKGGFAGSITAALFLRRFVDRAPYMHFDIYGWQPSAAPARPVGGVGQGARAVLAALHAMLDL